MQTEVKTLSERNIRDEQDFQDFVSDELKLVTKGLNLEKKARQKTDDEIVAAIHVYTSALQKGLKTAARSR